MVLLFMCGHSEVFCIWVSLLRHWVSLSVFFTLAMPCLLLLQVTLPCFLPMQLMSEC